MTVKFTQYTILFWLLIGFTAPTQAQYTPFWSAAKEQIFAEFVATQMALDQAPGLTVGFIKGDYMWVRGFGYADLENKLPAGEKTAYRIASVTKPMTAMAIIALAQAGKLDLDADIRTYVPYFPKKPFKVTARQLLGHLGGISHYRNYSEEGHFKDRKDTRQAIEVFAAWDLVAKPGTRFQYSSYGYNLLGAAIEGASGQSYDEYMSKRIWAPLKMNDMAMDDPKAENPHRARGYRLVNGKLAASEIIDISSRFAAGGTRGTVPDMLKFAQGAWSHKILSPQNTHMMWDSMRLADGTQTGYAMGWVVDNPKNGHFLALHSGSQQETRTLLCVFPALKLAMAVALNFEGGDRERYLGRLFELLTDEVTRSYYSKDETIAVLLQAMEQIYIQGLSHFERHAGAATNDATALAQAFEFFQPFQKGLTGEVTVTEMKSQLAQATALKAREPFLKMGSYMAERLIAQGAETPTNHYHSQGPITFFLDYAERVQVNPNTGIPLLTPGFVARLRNWQSGLIAPNTKLQSAYPLLGSLSLDHLRSHILPTFAAMTVYADYSRILNQYAYQLGNAGRTAEGLGFLKAALALYPDQAFLHDSLGEFYLSQGERDKAIAAYRKALELAPNSRNTQRALRQLEKKP